MHCHCFLSARWFSYQLVGARRLLPLAQAGCRAPTAQQATVTPSPTSQASPTAAPTATPTATPAATTTPSGQGTASDNDFSLTARNQGTYTESNQFVQPSAGDKYVSIYVELTNKNAQNAMMGNPFSFTLFDNQNIGHQAATASFGAPNNLQTVTNSKPGDKTAGVIVFELPAGNTPVKIVYSEGLLSGSLTVNL